MANACPPELRQRYLEGRVIPFVGAGISMSVTWRDGKAIRRGPSWTELVDKAAKLLDFDNPTLARVRGTDLQILEYFKLKNSGATARLTNWLATSVDPPDEALQNAPALRALCNLTRANLFYTTNFDNLLERGLQLFGRKPKTIAVEAEMGLPNSGCDVVKFHGDLDHPAQIVLTESDYQRRLKLNTPMDHRLRADLLGRVILFVGYSFRDPNVSYLFRLFTEDFIGNPNALTGPRGFITVPDPSDFEMRLFEQRHLRILPVRGDRIAEDTAAILEEMGS